MVLLELLLLASMSSEMLFLLKLLNTRSEKLLEMYFYIYITWI